MNILYKTLKNQEGGTKDHFRQVKVPVTTLIERLDDTLKYFFHIDICL